MCLVCCASYNLTVYYRHFVPRTSIDCTSALQTKHILSMFNEKRHHCPCIWPCLLPTNVREKANLEKPSGVDLSGDAHCRHQLVMEKRIRLRCVKNTSWFDRINAFVERRNFPQRWDHFAHPETRTSHVLCHRNPWRWLGLEPPA